MITPSLQHYESIARITQQMLDFARAHEWDQVTALSQDYKKAVAQLQHAETAASSTGDNAYNHTKQQLLERILANDAAIQQLIKPEQHRLGRLIGDTKRQHDVIEAYSAPSLNP